MEYTCIFDPKQKCPVKTEYKLKPESLVEFCKICRVPNAGKRKLEFETFIHLSTAMGDIQRKLGEQTALAEVYKKLYEEAKGAPH